MGLLGEESASTAPAAWEDGSRGAPRDHHGGFHVLDAEANVMQPFAMTVEELHDRPGPGGLHQLHKGPGAGLAACLEIGQVNVEVRQGLVVHQPQAQQRGKGCDGRRHVAYHDANVIQATHRTGRQAS
jgi:hypothetical protein